MLTVPSTYIYSIPFTLAKLESSDSSIYLTSYINTPSTSINTIVGLPSSISLRSISHFSTYYLPLFSSIIYSYPLFLILFIKAQYANLSASILTMNLILSFYTSYSLMFTFPNTALYPELLFLLIGMPKGTPKITLYLTK